MQALTATLIAGVVLVGPTAGAQEPAMSYAEAVAFLKRHTEVVELRSPGGGRVAVTPAWQGRVMTSACGEREPSFGFIHREFIEAKTDNPHFNNFGGEERLWLSPEGGPFSLWFKPGDPQDLDHWFTPPALNAGSWPLAAPAKADECRMRQAMSLGNASGAKFELAVERRVRLATAADLATWFSPAVASAIAACGHVAYETENRIENAGPPMVRDKGLVSIWILGMLNSGPQTVVVVPYRAGGESARGPVVKSDYFGPIPPERLKVTPEAILFVGDARHRSKIGTSQQRAKNVLGSIDFAAGALTLVHFTMPDDPAAEIYLNNMWGRQDDSFRGDVVNSYNDGPPAPGKKGLGAFYEIESLSPARALATGASLVHCHRTVHVQADAATLARIAKAALGVDLQQVRATVFGQ